MAARAEAVADTRHRIVEAAKALHAQQGVVRTSWDDIAERAGVSTATTYRHFPSLAELIPACARSVFDIIEPPGLEEAELQFPSDGSPADRLEHLVRASCVCYAKGRGWLHAAHRERDFVAELDAAVGILDESLKVLVAAAAHRELPRAQLGLLFALCDFPFWWSLRAAGLTDAEAEEQIVRLVRIASAA
ncbi:MAG: TetR family transcriptional regulator [Nitriliruptorales bacterium]|nr:TetR family transcriptional regulator [Nitriliruptorales bacterium]